MNDDAQTNGENEKSSVLQPESEGDRSPEEQSVQEAEKESQTSAKPEQETRLGNGKKPEESGKVVSKPVKRAPSFWNRALRWTLGFLIVFGLGFVAAIFLFYLPARQQTNSFQTELQNTRLQATQDANASQQKVSDLENQVQQLSSLDTKNKQLQNELNRAQLHIAILSARTDVASAQLALEKKDTSKAHAVLSQTPNTLDSMSSNLASNQQKLVEDMKARLKLADGEIDSNAFAAQSDLTVLATSLLELENAMFTQP